MTPVSSRFVVLAVLWAGCATVDTGATFSWPTALRPVTVLVDDTLPADCLVAARDAIAFWEEHVDYLQTMSVSPDTRPLLGEVFITWGDLDPPMVGVCDRETFGRDLLRAIIRIENCRTQTIVHELAHGLGLDHVDDPDNVMYPELRTTVWGLEDWQLEQIR